MYVVDTLRSSETRFVKERPLVDEAKSLDRAMRLIFELARHPTGLTVTELARNLNVQRAPLYRPLQTLAKYRIVRKAEGKLYVLGSGLLELAQSVSGSEVEEILPFLKRAADEASYTIFMVVGELDEIVTLTSAEPTAPGMYLNTKPGVIHPAGMIAPRVALMTFDPPSHDDSAELVEARRLGYAVTSQTSTGRTAIAAPVRVGAVRRAAAVLLVVDQREVDLMDQHITVVVRTAQEIADYYSVARDPSRPPVALA
jgi:DNA-binding IclR family transcriptional regulator